MLSFFANIFGYILNLLYQVVNNYGLAIIVFSVILKLVLLPVSIKQQKTMKKSTKIQAKMREIQDKYKNNPEKLNQETIELYKREKMSPFSGCLSAIAQIIILFAVFYLVRSPLTYMKKVDPALIEQYTNEIKQEEENKNTPYPEIAIIKEKGSQDERVAINMNFLGLDLSKIPQQNLSDWTVYIIPVLYILSSFVSIKLTTKMQESKNKSNSEIIDITEDAKKEDNKLVKVEETPAEEEFDAIAQSNKMMSWMIPIMSVSISLVAPLGLALYWLVNNITMILERVILNKVIKDE